jgi:DNA-binding GntR family transcriptional regulator
MTEDAMIPLLSAATRIACRQMTPQHLNALHASVEQASCLSARHDWERKATSHAELFTMLGDLTELTASRRILAVGDQMRRRIERDLHDGVQPRTRRGRAQPGSPLVAPAARVAAVAVTRAGGFMLCW